MAEPRRAALARCVEIVLDLPGGTVPVPAGAEPLARLGEWLGGRNLGAVQPRDPGSFAWAGKWIGLRSDAGSTDGWRPVVMFGSPSGTLVDPLEAELGPAAGELLEGLVLAPLSREELAGVPGRGTVEALIIAPASAAAPTTVASAAARPGGLEGDRYALGLGKFSASGRSGQDLTLIEAEALDELAADHGIELEPAEARRNVVTRGIALDALIGHRFRVGEVECFGQRRAEPCAHLQALTKPGVLRGLVHRGGIRADIVSAGTISIGDPVEPQD